MCGAGVEVEFMSYEYAEYRQLHGAFAPNVSVIDLLFMMGSESGRFIWS